jgi:ubiquinone/menaquinone biosynthesis C-methylase UbiE
MLDYLQKRGEDGGWKGLETKVVDGDDMENVEKESFTHVLCTFGIFMLPNALEGMYQVTKKGGFVGVTTWKSLTWYVFSLSISLSLSFAHVSSIHFPHCIIYNLVSWLTDARILGCISQTNVSIR